MKALAVSMCTVGNMSFGMIGRILGVSNVAVIKWVRIEAKQLPEPAVLKGTTLIQINEMWHFVDGWKTKFGSEKPMIAFQGE